MVRPVLKTKTNALLTGWVFEDERAEFMVCVKHASIATGFARVTNSLFLRIDMLPKGKRSFIFASQNY